MRGDTGSLIEGSPWFHDPMVEPDGTYKTVRDGRFADEARRSSHRPDTPLIRIRHYELLCCGVTGFRTWAIIDETEASLTRRAETPLFVYPLEPNEPSRCVKASRTIRGGNRFILTPVCVPSIIDLLGKLGPLLVASNLLA
jgi:hypothetical protein